MQSLSSRIRQASALLSPLAVPHEGRLGRPSPEPEDETRFPFQRDRDRIIHTQAFRRLKGKTQVFVAGGSDHVRTRLTHTMEVAQISRDIARTLALNEDLAECIALAHDLGHPPFGHAGEEALAAFLRAHGSHFEHNEQSLRIVTLLETHSSKIPGLNLNKEVLEGLNKHSTPFDQDFPHPPISSLEAQIVNLADEIAYTAHDCDDGISSGAFGFEELLAVPLARDAWEHAKNRGTQIRGSLIHLLVTDLYAMMEKEKRMNFSTPIEARLKELRAFLWKHLYLHPTVKERNEEGQRIVTALCKAFEKDTPAKVRELQAKTGGTLPEAVKDYVAGMTDGFATFHYQRLSET